VQVWALAAAVALVVLGTVATRSESNLRRLGVVVTRTLPARVRVHGMRFAIAVAVVGAAFAAAFYVHQRKVPTSNGCEFVGYVCKTHPSWEDPIAVLIAIGGITLAMAIFATGSRRLVKRYGGASRSGDIRGSWCPTPPRRRWMLSTSGCDKFATRRRDGRRAHQSVSR
jgi:hypothetical protein